METIPQTISPAETVRQLPCTLCWARSGTPCQRRPVADHLQRWLDAHSAGQVTKDSMGLRPARCDETGCQGDRVLPADRPAGSRFSGQSGGSGSAW